VPDVEAGCTALSMARTEQWEDVRLANLRYAVDLLSTWGFAKREYAPRQDGEQPEQEEGWVPYTRGSGTGAV
jgi:hypothetical protein